MGGASLIGYPGQRGFLYPKQAGPGAMRGFQIVALILGTLILGFGSVAGLLGAVSALSVRDGAAPGFFNCAMLAAFFGGLLFVVGRGAERRIEFRSAVALTASAWTVMPLLGSVPLMADPINLPFTKAVFEAVSGITTTGSTVMTGLDDTAPTILFWRSFLQWIGGIGIIGLSIAILPYLRVGGMQLFHMESSDKSEDRLIARPSNLAAMIFGLYLLLTALCFTGYQITGMSSFDAIAHAMTTVSTGGYSTSDSSMAAFSAGSQWVAIVFMAGGAIPFLAYVRAFSRHEGRRPGAFEEVVGLLALIAAFSVIMVIAQMIGSQFTGDSVRLALFNVVSVITTCGYAVGDYQDWGSLAIAGFFVLTFLGGCAGSTSGGFKVFRIQIMVKSIWRGMQQASSPRAIIVARHAGQKMSNADIASVALFAGVYVGCFALSSVLLAALGLDFVTAITGAATALANVGPGLGDTIGPAGNFASLPDPALWILAFVMILGRLEIMVILLLLTPRFWNR